MSSDVPIDLQSQRKESSEKFSRYIEQHCILEFLKHVLAEVAIKRPYDPFAFACEKLRERAAEQRQERRGQTYSFRSPYYKEQSNIRKRYENPHVKWQRSLCREKKQWLGKSKSTSVLETYVQTHRVYAQDNETTTVIHDPALYQAEPLPTPPAVYEHPTRQMPALASSASCSMLPTVKRKKKYVLPNPLPRFMTPLPSHKPPPSAQYRFKPKKPFFVSSLPPGRMPYERAYNCHSDDQCSPSLPAINHNYCQDHPRGRVHIHHPSEIERVHSNRKIQSPCWLPRQESSSTCSRPIATDTGQPCYSEQENTFHTSVDGKPQVQTPPHNYPTVPQRQLTRTEDIFRQLADLQQMCSEIVD